MKTFFNNCVTLAAGFAFITICGQAFAESKPDSNEALTLQIIMQDLGKEMQIVTDGISREDWEQVEKAASRIANHPQPALTERTKIMDFVGTDASKFKANDKKTHEAARALAEAAAQKNGQTVISAFATLQDTCLTCHNDFRKPIQDHFYNQR